MPAVKKGKLECLKKGKLSDLLPRRVVPDHHIVMLPMAYIIFLEATDALASGPRLTRPLSGLCTWMLSRRPHHNAERQRASRSEYCRNVMPHS